MGRLTFKRLKYYSDSVNVDAKTDSHARTHTHSHVLVHSFSWYHKQRDKTLYIKEIYCDLAHIFIPFAFCCFSLSLSLSTFGINLLILLLCYVYKCITLFLRCLNHSFVSIPSHFPSHRFTVCYAITNAHTDALCTDCLTGASAHAHIELLNKHVMCQIFHIYRRI